MGRAAGGHKLWTLVLWGRLLLTARLALGTVEEVCNCSTAIAFPDFQAASALEMCCLNFTETPIDSLDWSLFGGVTGLRELYLSRCGIMDIVNATHAPIRLEILHLDHNRLEKLPDSFLVDAPQLRVLRLDSNKLRELPSSFLRASTQIQEINLGFNDLGSLPPGVFKPSLLRLGLSNNSWDCTCPLFSALEKYPREPPIKDALGTGVVCSTPAHYRGLNIRDIRKQELCQAHSLTALFICLPLVAVSALVIWCYCRQKKKMDYALSHRPECHLATVERNGAKELPAAPTESEKNVLLKNQVLLKPSTALLGSSRDLYEEVEIELGASDDSLVLVNEGCLSQELCTEGAPLAAATGALTGGEPEAETESVTEVLKDSVDREKLYLSQAVDYYSLVPAIELEDSDHQEYESVDLH
uniref:LRRCT domain-containing protein n=1 Tax=Pelusios castaneus TaxID=367368 RepID=A0A8C8VPV4_9SAUR